MAAESLEWRAVHDATEAVPGAAASGQGAEREASGEGGVVGGEHSTKILNSWQGKHDVAVHDATEAVPDRAASGQGAGRGAHGGREGGGVKESTAQRH